MEINEQSILVYVLASIVFMLCFAVAVIWFLNSTQKKIIQAKLKEQERELEFRNDLLVNTVKTQETERERISKELHDDVTSKLSIIHLNLHLLKEKIEENDETSVLVDQIETSLKNSTERTRTIAHELMPAMLKKFGFHHALNELANAVNMTGVLLIKIDGAYSIEISDRFKLLHIYRIIQELVNNSLKYAKAKHINIDFEKIDNRLQMTFKDDGIGFEISKSTAGLGMGNIKTRIQLLDGKIEFISSPGKGLTTISNFPNYD